MTREEALSLAAQVIQDEPKHVPEIELWAYNYTTKAKLAKCKD
jgi:hypothetical protein